MRKQSFRVPEKAIQEQILQYLAFKGIYAYRINAGMIQTGEGRRKRMVRMAPAGFSDILAVLPKTGQACFIEVKAGKNQPTDRQKSFLEDMRKQWAKAFVAWSVEDVEEGLQESSLGVA